MTATQSTHILMICRRSDCLMATILAWLLASALPCVSANTRVAHWCQRSHNWPGDTHHTGAPWSLPAQPPLQTPTIIMQISTKIINYTMNNKTSTQLINMPVKFMRIVWSFSNVSNAWERSSKIEATWVDGLGLPWEAHFYLGPCN